MKKLVLATLAAFTLTASTVDAHPDRITQAEAMQPVTPAELGFTLIWADARPGHRGETNTVHNTITVFVRWSDTAQDLGRVLAHEIGHAVDVTRNDWADRQRWADARGITVWWPSDWGPDLAVGAGDFAECYASWAVGSVSLSKFGSCRGTGSLMSELVLGRPRPVFAPIVAVPVVVEDDEGESVVDWWARVTGGQS